MSSSASNQMPNWDDNESVVTAAVPGVSWAIDHGREGWCRFGKDRIPSGFLGRSWSEAREHPFVKEWERIHRPYQRLVRRDLGEKPVVYACAGIWEFKCKTRAGWVAQIFETWQEAIDFALKVAGMKARGQRWIT